MKRNCLVLIFLFMLLLTTGAFGYSGDVCVKFNPDVDGNVWYGQENTVEIWIQNSDPIQGLSIGFEFTSTLPGMSWKTPYGNKPNGQSPLPPTPACTKKPMTHYVQEWGDVVGALNDKLLFTYEVCLVPEWPYRFLLGGADADTPIPPHAVSTKAWDLKLLMPVDPNPLTPETLTVAPKFIPEAGSWKFVWDADNFTQPTFCGLSTGDDPQNPQLANGPIAIPIVVKPCGAPAFLPPVPGAQVSSSHSGYTFTFNADKGEKDWTGWSTDVGSIDGPITAGVLTITPSPANQFCPPAVTAVKVGAINKCVATTYYPFTITWLNYPPIINCPPDPASTPMKALYTRTFTATDQDSLGPVKDADHLTWTATSGNANPLWYEFDGSLFKFTPDTAGTYNFTITATDMCGDVGTCAFVVKAVPIRFNIVQIPKMGEKLGVGPTHEYPGFVFQGTYETVPVKMGLTETGLQFAGYNLLIHYDASALSFVSAKIGPLLGPCPPAGSGSGWEYFTYRFGNDGNCGGPCPSGLLRIVALAETNNGPNHPGCGTYPVPPSVYDLNDKEIALLKFYVTNNRTYQCQYTEIGFAWIDCGDNSFSDPTGNELYIAGDSAVHTFEWDKWLKADNLILCTDYPITTDSADGVVIGGWCPKDGQYMGCNNNNPAKQVIENLYFMNGGIDIACADEIDARGDVNLNGVKNEIADAVVFTNFFIKGISAFTINPQGQVAATDVNNDGHVLTVGDLVYLLRIIVGDALPIQKLSPFAGGVTVNVANGSVSTESASELGAVYATFAINGAYSVSNKTNMKLESGEVNGELKVLVYSGMSNLSNRIASGTNELFTVSGDVELKSVEVADYYGNMLSTRLNKISLPTSFALSQNVPNPFNPTTKLGFALPNQTEWTLSIYNVAGQLVKSFSGNNIGNVSVEWDASMAPSGVYFYKLNAGSYSDTKKMVLMK